MSPTLKHYHKNRDRRMSEMRASRLTPRIRASCLISGAKRRAKDAGLDFHLDLEWLAPKIERGTCEVTGLPFVLQAGRHAFAPSLDRSDNTQGYTRDNTKAVVWIYNTAKGNWTHDEIVTFARAIVEAEDGATRH